MLKSTHREKPVAVGSGERKVHKQGAFYYAPVAAPSCTLGCQPAPTQNRGRLFCYLSSSSTAGSRTTTGRTIKSPVGSQTADTRFPHLRATTGAHHPERPLLGKPLYCHRQQDRRKEGGVCKL